LDAPGGEEELHQQLDLVLVSRQHLIKDAYRRVRASQITIASVLLPAVIVSELRLEPSQKNLYGIFPADLNRDERKVVDHLDTDDEVLWWHRNPVRQPSSVGLYGWADGQGFSPDFVVGMKNRKIGDGVVLLEVKGGHLLHQDRHKAAAKHQVYDRVYMVGRERAGNPFKYWRLQEDKLLDDGEFEVGRLRW